MEVEKVMPLYRQRQKVVPYVTKIVTCVLVCTTYNGCQPGYCLLHVQWLVTFANGKYC